MAKKSQHKCACAAEIIDYVDVRFADIEMRCAQAELTLKHLKDDVEEKINENLLDQCFDLHRAIHQNNRDMYLRIGRALFDEFKEICYDELSD